MSSTLRSRLSIPLVGILALCLTAEGHLNAQDSPRIEVEGLKLSLFASQPKIVTPVSCAFDAQGDLYVIESNTHFRPDNYPGPKFDRIYRYPAKELESPNPEPVVFTENSTHTMQICAGPDDWIYVSTRREVRRMHSREKLPIAEGELILKLDTKGDYPHNGLSGMVIGPDGKLYVGMGENLGEPYSLVSSSKDTIKGGGEGGNIFRCNLDGSSLERIATGFWNPFGLCFDEAGRLWCVDNDPDASPPCRLVHVVPGGDYGFEFQFGRSGTNPLIAWNGQLPGTLGYAAGTGESPCAIVMHRGYLWVTSWGDNRVERFKIQLANQGEKGPNKEIQQTATMTAIPEVVIQGGPNFRPVGMALRSNGSLYFTDWVDRSYTLHSLGKIWRIDIDPNSPTVEVPGRTKLEQIAQGYADNDSLWKNPKDALARESAIANTKSFLLDAPNVEEKDSFFQTAVMWCFVKNKMSSLSSPLNWKEIRQGTPHDRVRSTILSGLRWEDLNHQSPMSTAQRSELLREALQDNSESVRLVALRWIAEVKDTQRKPDIDRLLSRSDLSTNECRVALAALEFLERGMAERSEVGGHRVASSIAHDVQKPAKLRTLALQLLSPLDPSLKVDELSKMALESSGLGREATRVLALRDDEASRKVLAELASNKRLDEQLRADAVMGLAGDSLSPANRDLLAQLAKDESKPVRTEAFRILARWEAKKPPIDRPADTDIDGWLRRLKDDGSPDAGWRVFFRAGSGQCSACHAFSHRGAKVGPDLSTIGGTQSKGRILESLLQPSREIGPLYVPWQIVTTDGNVLTGIKLHTPGASGKTRYLSSKGDFFDVGLEEIDQQKMVTQSIMPTGLCGSLDDSEIEDLLALLTTR